MLKEVYQVDRAHLPDEAQSMLPEMTALFIAGLGATSGAFANPALYDQHRSHSDTTAKIFRMPLSEEAILNRSGERITPQIRLLKRINRQNTFHQKDSEHKSAIRHLIFGISHHFNNLLMGIWGNATLIRMQLVKDSPLLQSVFRMEDMLQTGSFLTHTVLGYIGERRSLAKKIRLNQLLNQINQNIHVASYSEGLWDFEAALKWASCVQQPRMVAGSAARVLEVLFHEIQAHCLAFVPLKVHNKGIQDKLEMIDQLIRRGLDLTHQLRLYAADFKPSSVRFRLAPLVRRVVNQIFNVPASIQVNFDPGKRIPLLSGERNQLEWVLEQLIDNAIAAMPHGGNIDITLRTLQQETAQDRCAVHKGCDYVVVTVKDNGKGIPNNIQKNIFEPFFTHPKQKRRIGVGLAAADGVLKSHNGYIQVQSKHRIGSTFKLYLPIAGTALLGQKLKHMSG